MKYRSHFIRCAMFFYLFTLSHASYAADAACIKYDSAEKKLYGSIKESYSAVSNAQKQPGVIWVLKLQTPFCVEAKDGMLPKKVSEVQLIMEPEQYKTYANYVTFPDNTYWIQATGIFSDATPGQHITEVVLKVKDINRAPML